LIVERLEIGCNLVTPTFAQQKSFTGTVRKAGLDDAVLEVVLHNCAKISTIIRR
jgi:hypothetical protein